MKISDFSHCLTHFFTVHLPGRRNASTNTIAAYRDTFSQLLVFFASAYSVKPEKLKFSHFSRETIQEFLAWIATERHCGPSTQNQRLAAIRSFFRYVQIEQPEQLFLAQSILAIESRKVPTPAINYLTHAATKLLLEQPNPNIGTERRDLALLLLLYDSAARVQELCDLTARNIRLNTPAVVRVTGKGQKSRDVPLSHQTAAVLKKYLHDNNLDRPEMLDAPLFTNRQGGKLTRSGVSYILRKYVTRANNAFPNTLLETISPHCLRHSKAMHLLESGVNLIYIRDFLGHEDIMTTQIYARANPEAKRAAIAKVYSCMDVPEISDWNADNDLMSFLKRLT